MSITVCFAKCESCMAGRHFEPPVDHGWADAEDIEHARNTNQPPPTQRCACPCAVVTP